jgi:hypothetical protein
VTKVEAAVVPTSPVILVAPQLVIPLLPPKPPNAAAAPRLGAAPAGPGFPLPVGAAPAGPGFPLPVLELELSPLSLPQPATKVATANARNHIRGLEKFANLSIRFSSKFDAEIGIDEIRWMDSQCNGLR